MEFIKNIPEYQFWQKRYASVKWRRSNKNKLPSAKKIRSVEVITETNASQYAPITKLQRDTLASVRGQNNYDRKAKVLYIDANTYIPVSNSEKDSKVAERSRPEHSSVSLEIVSRFFDIIDISFRGTKENIRKIIIETHKSSNKGKEKILTLWIFLSFILFLFGANLGGLTIIIFSALYYGAYLVNRSDRRRKIASVKGTENR